VKGNRIEQKYVTLLPTIFSDAFCLSIYEKVNYCKIQDCIIKTLTSSNKKHFLVCTSKV